MSNLAKRFEVNKNEPIFTTIQAMHTIALFALLLLPAFICWLYLVISKKDGG